MFDNDVLIIQHTSSSCNKCIFIQWMNTLIIAEAELINKDDATVQLRISAVLLRKAGCWDVPYAISIKKFSMKSDSFGSEKTTNVFENIIELFR